MQKNFKDKKILLESIVAAVIVGAIVFVALVSFAPDTTPYSVNNYGWNGMHNMSVKYSVQELSTLSGAPFSNETTLLIIAPVSDFSQAGALFVRQFVQYGGTVIIADSYGYSNSLLREMGLGVQIGNEQILDPSFNWGAAIYPVALVNSNFATEFPFLSNVSGIALTKPRALVISSPDVSIIATSSAQSVAISPGQTLGSNISSIQGQHGTFPLVAAQRIGRGFVFIVGDSSIFTNSVITQADNSILASNLLSSFHVYLDTSHWPLNTVTSLKAQFFLDFQQLSAVPLRYLLTLCFVGVAVFFLMPAFTGIFSVERERGMNPKASGDVSTFFNNDILTRVKRDREKFGVQHE